MERGKLPLAEYAVKEAKLLAYKLVADYEQLAEEGEYLKWSVVQKADLKKQLFACGKTIENNEIKSKV